MISSAERSMERLSPRSRRAIPPGEATPSAHDHRDWLDAAFRKDYTPLVRLAALLVDREVAEELVQDAFVRTHGRLSRIAPDKVSVYLRSAVINGARSHLRRRSVQRRHLPAADPPAVAAEVGGVAAAQRAELLEALEHLPNRQREVLLLRYFLDLSELEIAETLGISPGSVKQHAHRGLASLASSMGGER
jgi:RNA polymerase sigma-70 factor (sigma-E family)